VRQRKAIVVGVGLLMASAGAAAAADYRPVPEPPTTEAYAASGFYLRGDAGWSWLDWSAAENNANSPIAGGGVGYQWGPMFRTDVRFDYGFDYDLGHDDNASIGTVTANGYVDVPLGFPVTPYVGAGLGWGFVTGDAGDDKNGLAAALTGGVTFDVNQSVAVDVGYRFRTIATDGSLFSSDSVNDHSVTGGLRFKF
jgi:opacity protein-like surface antigen